MPASLTVQVRLGFSMGWRIWTPNEVGFYAKTLAHSYFILVILKSKFLKEMIWIVNYNLFMGTKKYHVFIEFLQFGMKSTEERCVWKKIMFISLFARHKKMTKAFFKSKHERFKVVLIKAKLGYLYPYRGDQKAVLKVYESNVFKRGRLFLKNSYGLSVKSDIETLKYRHRKPFGKLRGVLKVKKKLNFVSKFFFFNYLKKKSVSSTRFLMKFSKLYKKLFFKQKQNKVTKSSKTFTNAKGYSYFFKKIPFLKIKSRGFFIKKDTENFTGVGNPGDFVSNAEKTLMEGFKYDPVFSQNNYSVFSGPRKRLSRNLRRAFKGKHVKIASNLLWFWEKIGKMLTYFVRKHVLIQKRVL